jgi:hypothetical protein
VRCSSLGVWRAQELRFRLVVADSRYRKSFRPIPARRHLVLPATTCYTIVLDQFFGCSTPDWFIGDETSIVRRGAADGPDSVQSRASAREIVRRLVVAYPCIRNAGGLLGIESPFALEALIGTVRMRGVA